MDYERLQVLSALINLSGFAHKAGYPVFYDNKI